MTPFKTVPAILALFAIQFAALAQNDTAKITARALVFADSLIKTDAYQNWSLYADLVPATIIKYYGGKDGYVTHVQGIRQRTTTDRIAENYPERKIMSIMTKKDQWQCVVRVSRYFHQQNIKYHYVTYLVGQSKDEGETWRIFDVNYNSVANIIYMLPDIFDDIAIPQPTVISEEQELAAQSATKPSAAKSRTPRGK